MTDAKMHKCSWDLINSDIIIYFCKIVLTIVLLEIQLHFVNYDHVFRSFNCILEVKIVLSMQLIVHRRVTVVPNSFLLSHT